MKRITRIIAILAFISTTTAKAEHNYDCQKTNSQKQRILISSDIGGTDPDDNQSVADLLMYSNEFDIEGLVSSPSFGNGNKREILRMIDVYEKDLPILNKHISGLMTPEELRPLVKQGRQSEANHENLLLTIFIREVL